jgi:hypothetical protein
MDAQETECHAYAERQGWEVVAIFKDWQTGTELFERAEMTRCREAMRRGEFDILLVDRLDRLSRKAHHQGFIRTEAEYAGVSVASATQDLSNPIMVGVYGGMGEANRDDLVKNMARGKRTKAEKHGLPLGQGKPPFGLSWRTTSQAMPDGAVVVRKVGYAEDPVTIGYLRRIFTDYDRGRSLRGLGMALEADGVLPPYHDRSGSTAWSAGTLRAILRNSVYIGRAEAFRTVSDRERNEHGEMTRRHRERASEDRVLLPAETAPVVIDPALFARVQCRLERSKRESCRRDRDPQVGILRRGYGICGGCTRPLTVVKGNEKDRLPYYRCHTDGKRLWNCPGTGAIPVATLDEEIWTYLLFHMNRENPVAWHEAQPQDAGVDAADLAVVDRLLAQIERQQANLAQAIAMMGDNPDGVAPLLAQLDLLAKQRRASEADRTDILARQARHEATAAQRRALQERRKEIAAQMAEVKTYADRRRMIDVLGVKVTLYPADHKPRWTATCAIDPEGSSSDNLYSGSGCTAGT